jgi:hypothetical protein
MTEKMATYEPGIRGRGGEVLLIDQTASDPSVVDPVQGGCLQIPQGSVIGVRFLIEEFSKVMPDRDFYFETVRDIRPSVLFATGPIEIYINIHLALILKVYYSDRAMSYMVADLSDLAPYPEMSKIELEVRDRKLSLTVNGEDIDVMNEAIDKGELAQGNPWMTLKDVSSERINGYVASVGWSVNNYHFQWIFDYTTPDGGGDMLIIPDIGPHKKHMHVITGEVTWWRSNKVAGHLNKNGLVVHSGYYEPLSADGSAGAVTGDPPDAQSLPYNGILQNAYCLSVGFGPHDLPLVTMTPPEGLTNGDFTIGFVLKVNSLPSQGSTIYYGRGLQIIHTPSNGLTLTVNGTSGSVSIPLGLLDNHNLVTVARKDNSVIVKVGIYGLTGASNIGALYGGNLSDDGQPVQLFANNLTGQYLMYSLFMAKRYLGEEIIDQISRDRLYDRSIELILPMAEGRGNGLYNAAANSGEVAGLINNSSDPKKYWGRQSKFFWNAMMGNELTTGE